MIGRHRSQQRGGAELGVDQPVLQPPQRRMRFEQAIGRGHEPAGVVLGLRQHGEQFLIGLFGRGVLAKLSADFLAAATQGAVAAGHVLHRTQLGQIAAHAILGRRQRGGRLVQIGLGQTDGLGQLVDHALGLGVAELLELGLKLLEDGLVQRHRSVAVFGPDGRDRRLRSCRTRPPWAERA